MKLWGERKSIYEKLLLVMNLMSCIFKKNILMIFVIQVALHGLWVNKSTPILSFSDFYYTHFLFSNRKVLRNSAVTVLGSCDLLIGTLFSDGVRNRYQVFQLGFVRGKKNQRGGGSKNPEFLIILREVHYNSDVSWWPRLLKTVCILIWFPVTF